MTVHCPHCSTGYLLPDSLMGPSGARVRCPQCGKAFLVLRDAPRGEAGTEATAPAPAAPEPMAAARPPAPAIHEAPAPPGPALHETPEPPSPVESAPAADEAPAPAVHAPPSPVESAPAADEAPAPAVHAPPSPMESAPAAEEAPAPAAPAAEAPPAPAPDGSPRQIAESVLEALAARIGAGLEESRRSGRLFSEHGAALMEAFDEYRRQVGKGARPDDFRSALRERWGIDLPIAPERAS